MASEPRELFFAPSPADVPAAYLALLISVLAYVFVITEEKTSLRELKPVTLTAGLIWVLKVWVAPGYDVNHDETEAALAARPRPLRWPLALSAF